MFIMANRNINLPNMDHSEVCKVARGFVGNIPDHFAKTPYFKALVRDGKIVVPKSTADKAVQGAREKADKALMESDTAVRTAAQGEAETSQRADNQE